MSHQSTLGSRKEANRLCEECTRLMINQLLKPIHLLCSRSYRNFAPALSIQLYAAVGKLILYVLYPTTAPPVTHPPTVRARTPSKGQLLNVRTASVTRLHDINDILRGRVHLLSLTGRMARARARRAPGTGPTRNGIL